MLGVTIEMHFLARASYALPTMQERRKQHNTLLASFHARNMNLGLRAFIR